MSELPVVQLAPIEFPPALDFHTLMDHLEAKHGYDHRDMAGNRGHFTEWCDAKGYGAVDPEGNTRGCSQLWFKEYNDDPTGKATCPPYQDFWHILIDFLGDFDRGGVTHFDLESTIEDADEDEIPDWALRVLKDMQEAVEGHVAYDDGVLCLHIDW